MCTSLTFKTNDFYFGRNMDLDYHFGEKIIITPRNYSLNFKHEKTVEKHYAMLGMACVKGGYPLYAEGVNEKGLCVSALNFQGNAYYNPHPIENALNLASYEIIPYILSKFSSVEEVKKAFVALQIIDTPFDLETETSPLHWHIADKSESITLESTKSGVKIYQNPIGILTNNPTFDFHLKNIEQYARLVPSVQNNDEFSLGLGMYGLNGDFSSASRFIRLTILKKYSISDDSESSSVDTAFRLLNSVAVIKGCVLTKDGKPHYTIYTCVINATKGIYYYKLYNELPLKSASINDVDLNSDTLYIKNC